MKTRLTLIALTLILSACNLSVTSLKETPTSSEPSEPLAAAVEMTATLYPDTPAPAVLNASRVESPVFVKIRFLNEFDGWAVTESQLISTNDGGVTWYNVTPPDVAATSTLAMSLLDRDHAWVLKPDFNNFPNNGLLYRTTDGGLTWIISSTPFSSGDLSFIDANNGWMLADLGAGAGSNAVAVFQTQDGGATWTKTYTNDPNDPQAGDTLPLGGQKSDLVPLNMQTAWVGGVIYSPGTVYLYRTDDGGHTWAPITLELLDEAEKFELSINKDQMQFVNNRDAFLVMRMAGERSQSAIYVTQDGGDTWAFMPALIPNTGAADFLSAQEAIIYNGEQFYVTRDAARTWTTVTPNIVFGDSFKAMDFVDLMSGWVVTIAEDQSSLSRTTDGGATWLPIVP